MVSEKETAKIRRFVRGELRDEPDLSTLTLGILKKRYLARVGRESLSPEAGNYMKQAVKEELMKMQDDDENGEELETKKPQNKRKREEENDEVINEREDPRAKKSRCLSSSSSESEDKEGNKSGSEESDEEDQIKSGSEDAEREVKRSQHKTNGNRKQQMDSEDSTDEEINESEKKGNKSKSGDSPKGMVKKKLNATKNGEKESSCTSPERKAAQSDGENETDTDNKSVRSEKINGDESSDDSEKEEKVSVEKKNNDTDSDSSSLPSLEDDKASGTEDNQDIKKKKTMKKEKSTRGQKNDDKAIVRLKRYIAVCGARQNYKKLLDGCHSVHSVVAVLNKTLQDLGVRGQPTIKKCKKVRIKREQAQELAGLDVSNIISTQGRPKRRGAWQAKHDPPSSTYLRTLNSGSESEEENDTHRGRRRATDWANLRGVISDDAESD
ncbi:HIRA-interacting protein 3 isoform X1 [Seriola aureovittata]|uniref:HIRA-interacting protein 3 isoform X1 n=1 Tax=Seriola aureovittata TaxID=2871759 RepID=UPI0024BDB136|nr:HIRA-interacting protein 3 isoform X1 [Seriola aureovittata]